jgi:uncharacterized protein (DUF924 family)
MDEHDEADSILRFWFGVLDDRGVAGPEAMARWWKKDDAFDREIRERFAAVHAAVLAGQRDRWLGAARARLAYVIVLDQLSRNMFRDTPAAFAADDRALDAALGGIARGLERRCALSERTFYYLPLMHCEDLAVQDRCVALFTAFRDEQRDAELAKMIGGHVDFAIRHRDIVARFGRFPHRNAILGRTSTEDETAFLAQPGSSF